MTASRRDRRQARSAALRRAFPDEVVALHDSGVPLANWYSGPLYEASPKQEREAVEELLRVRAEAHRRPTADAAGPVHLSG